MKGRDYDAIWKAMSKAEPNCLPCRVAPEGHRQDR